MQGPEMANLEAQKEYLELPSRGICKFPLFQIHLSDLS
jgi:hypothetical protein